MPNEQELGYIIAIVLLILLFCPIIIYRIYIYHEENKFNPKRKNREFNKLRQHRTKIYKTSKK